MRLKPWNKEIVPLDGNMPNYPVIPKNLGGQVYFTLFASD